MRWFHLFFITMLLLGIAPYVAAEEEDEVKEEGAEVEKMQLAYLSIKPSLVVNIKGGAKYIRCDIQLMTKDETNIEDIELYAPAIRHELLLLLGDQMGEELKTPEGKEALRQKALAAVAGVVTKHTGKTVIDDLFFTSFFVQ